MNWNSVHYSAVFHIISSYINQRSNSISVLYRRYSNQTAEKWQETGRQTNWLERILWYSFWYQDLKDRVVLNNETWLLLFMFINTCLYYWFIFTLFQVIQKLLVCWLFLASLQHLFAVQNSRPNIRKRINIEVLKEEWRCRFFYWHPGFKLLY